MTQSSSVLFSLEELARMEEERVRGVADAERRARLARQRADEEVRARARRDEDARQLAAAEALREVERRAREEAARIESIHRGATEAARVEADAKTRLEARESERRHERELERIRATSRGGGTRATIAAAAFGAVVACGAALALHLGVAVPHERASAAAAADGIASRDVAIADLREREAAAEVRAKSFEDDLAAARDENVRLHADLDAARRPSGPGPLPTTRHGPGTAHHADGPRLDGFTQCAAGSKDPLCLQ
ncbi:MAG TPA: hypothetical protein VGG39_33345 [Polyangiaceae bacterium]|jgi:colicin import membrane protein